MQIRIAFITIQKKTYSETFIQEQLRLLSGVKFFMWNMGKESEEGPISSLGSKNLEDGLVNFFNKNRINVVLAQYGLSGANVLDACMRLEIPLIVHFHGFDAYVRHVLKSYMSSYKRMFDYAASIIVVSTDMKKQLVKMGAKKEKIIYTPCGVNDIFFKNKPTSKGKTFVVVGRFVAKKAPHLILGAFREVLKEYPDAKLIFIGGGGSLLEACIDLSHYWEIAHRIEFLGIMSPEQILEIFGRSFCLLQHSVTTAIEGDAEGTPLAVLEAGAASLPVIATKHKGINEVIVDGETGLLVEERDVSEMAKCMIYLLRNRKIAFEMGAASRKRVQNNFSMNSYITILNNAIASAVTSR